MFSLSDCFQTTEWVQTYTTIGSKMTQHSNCKPKKQAMKNIDQKLGRRRCCSGRNCSVESHRLIEHPHFLRDQCDSTMVSFADEPTWSWSTALMPGSVPVTILQPQPRHAGHVCTSSAGACFSSCKPCGRRHDPKCGHRTYCQCIISLIMFDRLLQHHI